MLFSHITGFYELISIYINLLHKQTNETRNETKLCVHFIF